MRGSARIVVALALAPLVASCYQGTPLDACELVSCGGHGTCYLFDGLPECVCDGGATASGLTCVICGDGVCNGDETPSSCDEDCSKQGNEDADVEADADAQVDADSPADSDAEVDWEEEVDDPYACVEREVFADNPETPARECEPYPTPCDVPEFWAYFSSLDRCLDPTCGDFGLIVVAWAWEDVIPEADIYRFHTLLHVDGPEECYNFVGFDDCTWLDLRWDEGVHHDGNRAFEYRGGLLVGDIFETTEVWGTEPAGQTLQELIDMYGLPDEACGHVCNGDGFEQTYCAPLEARP